MLTELRIGTSRSSRRSRSRSRRGFNVLTRRDGCRQIDHRRRAGLPARASAAPPISSARAPTRRRSRACSTPRATTTLLALLDGAGVEVDDRPRSCSSASRGARAARARGSTARTTTAAVLAEVGRALVNLHGQHEAQSLLDEESQRAILDAFGGATRRGATSAQRTSWSRRRARDPVARARAAPRRSSARTTCAIVVARDRRGAACVAGEEAKLEDEARRLEHAEELQSLAAGHGRGARGRTRTSVLARLGHAAAPARGDPAHRSGDSRGCRSSTTAAFYALQELARETGGVRARAWTSIPRAWSRSRRGAICSFARRRSTAPRSRRRSRPRAPRARSSISSTAARSTFGSSSCDTSSRARRSPPRRLELTALRRDAAARLAARSRRGAPGARHARRPLLDVVLATASRDRIRGRRGHRVPRGAQSRDTRRGRWRAWRRAASCRA